MKLVKNDKIYWEFIRNLRNDPVAKKGFINQEYIDPVSHESHMKKNSNCYYVCVENSNDQGKSLQPLGYCGVIDDDIRVAVSPVQQGRGVGTFMINELITKHPTAIAKVKIENSASLALFEKCGFQKKYYILEKK